ncbi:MAG: hypothetical protein D6722_20105 [Bacteroidetes bacterium]|nr:MAG: hypothetical protein D6722_20105 [Bacteroidota bacterium]
MPDSPLHSGPAVSLRTRWEALAAQPHFPWLAAGVWFALNLLQASLTELFHDEAYYWFYSSRMAWAYAEHAPMIAWMIRLGGYLLPGEAGVRLFPVLMGATTVGLLIRETAPAQRGLMTVLIGAGFLTHLGGFFAAPDAPMACFAVAFLVLWRRYLERDDWRLALLTGIAVAALLYSKYHGAMVLFFAFWGWPGVVRRRSFWLLAGLALLLLTPLLLALVEQQFETFRFHLTGRIRKPNDGSFTINYLTNQPLVAGLLTGWLVLMAAFRRRPHDRFERSLRWILFGVLGFLFLVSLNTWVEANWSAAITAPLLWLAVAWLADRPSWQAWAYRLALPGIGLMLIFRAYLMVDFIPPLTKIRNEVHGWDIWAQQMKDMAGDRPLLFDNAYKYPAKYAFYAGGVGANLSNFFYHPTQYDAWGVQDSFEGDTVLYVTRTALEQMDTVQAVTGNFYYREVPNFQSYQQIRVKVLDPMPLEWVQDSVRRLSLRIYNDYAHPVDFGRVPERPASLTCNFFRRGKWVSFSSFPLDAYTLQDSLTITMPVPVKVAETGAYQIVFGIKSGWLGGWQNSAFLDVQVRAPGPEP